MMVENSVFWGFVSTVLNGYTMAFLCLIVHGLHMIKARYDSRGRRWSRFWKGATYGMLGVAFILTELNIMTVVHERLMLRTVVAILLLAEISYHLPDLDHARDSLIRFLSNLRSGVSGETC